MYNNNVHLKALYIKARKQLCNDMKNTPEKLYEELMPSFEPVIFFIKVPLHVRTEKYFRNLIKSIEIILYIPFPDLFGTKRTSVCFQINRKMVNTIWFWKDFSLCTVYGSEGIASWVRTICPVRVEFLQRSGQNQPKSWHLLASWGHNYGPLNPLSCITTTWYRGISEGPPLRREA